MTDKPVNPSVDNSGARGSALTPQQAAQACIKRIEHHLLELMVPEGVVNIEREFTEIISQVTPPLTLEQEMAWMAHKKQQNLAMWHGAEKLSYGYVTKSGKYVPAFPETENRFPQEIVEPQPKPWWKRWLR